jgi:succinoglycan biosynthesis protein ExoM
MPLRIFDTPLYNRANRAFMHVSKAFVTSSHFGTLSATGAALDPARSVGAVDVAVCTYRRASLDATLTSIAAQELPSGVSLRVIVADNDTTPSARAMVADAAARLNLRCCYVHAPSRNISIARNACLDQAAAGLLAFIDDDEIASPGWIAALLARMDETGADAVLGQAIASYPAEAPAWAAAADLHSTRPPITETGAIRTGYTCNVLLRLDAFAGQRFDLALGRSGGEDDMFFASAVRRGVRIAFAPDAVVADPVPLTRARLGWLCRRSFRTDRRMPATSSPAGATGRWRCWWRRARRATAWPPPR